MRPSSSRPAALTLMTLTAMAAALWPAAALAHDGGAHTHGLLDGLLHPITGLDHLAAMLLAGLWASQLGERAQWVAPVAFAASMLGGAVVARAGVAPQGVELLIAASVAVLGMLLALRARAGVLAGALVLGALAWAHGAAHGVEGPAVGFASYAAGFVAGTLGLHLAGQAIGQRLLADSPRLARAAGVVGVGLGALFGALAA